MRLATARAAFYGAALMPLAAQFPKEIIVDFGPERIPLFSLSLPSPDLSGVGDRVQWMAYAIVAIAVAGAFYRFVRTALAVIEGERVARAARERASDFRRFAYADVEGPMVVGLFKPLVVLPRRFEKAAAGDRLRVLRHEHAHLRRRDLRAALIQRLVEDVFWWNPFLARIGRHLAELREMASDEAAAGRAWRKTFARVLYTHASPAHAGGFGVHASGGGAVRRIERLVSRPKALSWPGLLLLFAAFSLSFCATPRSPDSGVTHTSIATS